MLSAMKMISQGRTTYLLKVSLGRNSTHKMSATKSKPRLTWPNLIKYGSTLERHQQTPGHSIRMTHTSRITTPRAISWTRYQSHQSPSYRSHPAKSCQKLLRCHPTHMRVWALCRLQPRFHLGQRSLTSTNRRRLLSPVKPHRRRTLQVHLFQPICRDPYYLVIMQLHEPPRQTRITCLKSSNLDQDRIRWPISLLSTTPPDPQTDLILGIVPRMQARLR